MAKEKLLKVLMGKCKDMGLSEKSITEIAGIASSGLKDGSTDEEIEAQANLFLPALKAMQGEATRWAQKATPPPTPPTPPVVTPPTPPNPTEGGDWKAALEAMEARYAGIIKTQGETITGLQTKLEGTDRANLISTEMAKLGLTAEDMEFVSVPSDANIPEFLGKVKQSFVNRGLRPADSNVTTEAKSKANDELAKSMLEQYEVKQ